MQGAVICRIASTFSSFNEVFEFPLTEILSSGIPVISAFFLTQTLCSVLFYSVFVQVRM